MEPTTVKCNGGNFCKSIKDTSADTQNYSYRLRYGHISVCIAAWSSRIIEVWTRGVLQIQDQSPQSRPVASRNQSQTHSDLFYNLLDSDATGLDCGVRSWICKLPQVNDQGRSTLTNLLVTLECWTGILKDGLGLDIIYLDYQKAFDRLVYLTVLASYQFMMVALCNRADHYIFMLWFVLPIYLFSSPNLSRRTLDVCHTSTHGVALVRI